jgi:hypothetical protein
METLLYETVVGESPFSDYPCQVVRRVSGPKDPSEGPTYAMRSAADEEVRWFLSERHPDQTPPLLDGGAGPQPGPALELAIGAHSRPATFVRPRAPKPPSELITTPVTLLDCSLFAR